MATYTKIDTKAANTICNSYDMQVTDCIAIAGGLANSNYHLYTSTGEYVLTVAEEKSWKEIERLVSLLEYLQTHQFPSSQVCYSKNRETTLEYLGKPIFLKKWIAGNIYQELTPEMLKELGRHIGKLHKIPCPPYIQQQHSYSLPFFANLEKKVANSEYRTWLQTQVSRLTKSYPKQMPQGLLHGDIFFDNVIFQKERLQAIIDFEETCCDAFAFDLGMGILGLCQKQETIDTAKAKHLLGGYETERRLTELEKLSLVFFIEYSATATSYWRYCHYHLHNPAPEQHNKYLEMVEIAKSIQVLAKDCFF
ncbi:MAG: homoserine kinase [Spirochaetota bacterium]